MKYLKKIAVAVGVIGCVIALIFTVQNKKERRIRIGVNVPTSGVLAFWGEELRRGMSLFSDQVGDIELIVRDNKGKPNEAVTAARTLVDINEVQAIVTMLVKLSAPQRPLAETARIPLISTYNSSNGFTDDSTYVYQDFATHEWQLPVLARYVIEELKLMSGAVLCSSDDFGIDGEKFFKKYYSELGGRVACSVRFTPGTVDMRNDVSKVLGGRPDFVFVVGQETEIVAAVRAIREVNSDIVILGVGSFESPSVWAAINEEQQKKLYFVNSAFDRNANDETRMFYDLYFAKHGAAPSMPAVYGYSICKYLSIALRRSVENGTDVRDELNKVNEGSIRGVLMVNDRREIVSDYGLYMRHAGKSVLLKSYKSIGNERK